MRTFFSTSFIALALFVSAAGIYVPSVHAQTLTKTDAAVVNSSAASSGTQTPVDFQKPPDVAAEMGPVMTWIMTLFAWLVGVAAITLDNAVYYTVVTMGNYIHNLSAIGVAWRILRDIGNIMLIFGFLAIGVTTILNVNWYGGGKKMLPMLLVAAVFLNFSLFISEAVIDTGNLFATQFYTQINGGKAAGAKSFDINSIQTDGISTKIMSQLGLQTIYNGGQVRQEVFQNGNTWLIGFMSIILFLVTAFVMFSLAFILIARFVALIFLIILAPVGFAGLAVPQLAARAKQWWGALFDQTITAPILLLMLYIALAVITDAQFLTGFGSGKDWTGFVSGGNLAGFGNMVLSFLVAIGLLLAVVIQAKRLSAFGAGWATKTAGNLTFGLTAASLRSTGGWASQRISQGLRNTRLARVPVVGRAVTGAFDRGAKASFDVRGTGALKNFPGGSIDAGAAQKGGFREWEKGKIKERQDYAKDLGQSTGVNILGTQITTNEKIQQKVEESRKKMMEQTVKDLGTQNRQDLQGLQEQHKKELEQPTAAVNEARQKLAKLQSDKGKGAFVSDEEINTAQKDLDAAETARKQKITEQQREQKKNEDFQKELIEAEQKKVKEQGEVVTKLENAGKEGYAQGLNLYIDQSKGGFLRKTANFVNPLRNAKAADNIRKEFKKTKSEKDLEIIKKALEDGEKPKEEKKEEPKPEATK